jgi:hypothetical protein
MKQVRLTKGLYALVSAMDYAWLNQFEWYASSESRNTKFYAIRWDENRKKVRMHRAIAELAYGPIPAGMVVDHINHNSLDNRRENLEVITQVENMKRSPGWKKKGVKVKQAKGE